VRQIDIKNATTAGLKTGIAKVSCCIQHESYLKCAETIVRIGKLI